MSGAPILAPEAKGVEDWAYCEFLIGKGAGLGSGVLSPAS